MSGGGGIPQNFDFGSFLGGGSGGAGGGPGFAAGWGGNTKQAGTTQAVADDKGVLKAYDPNTMSMTTTEVAPQADKYGQAAGYSANGLPSYITNWMASGGKDAAGKPIAMPTQSEMSVTPLGIGTTAAGLGKAGTLIKSPASKPHPDALLTAPSATATPAAATTATAPAAATSPSYAGATAGAPPGWVRPTFPGSVQVPFEPPGFVRTGNAQIDDFIINQWRAQQRYAPTAFSDGREKSFSGFGWGS